MGFKLKDEGAVIALVSMFTAGFFIGWYSKKYHVKVKEWISGKEEEKDE